MLLKKTQACNIYVVADMSLRNFSDRWILFTYAYNDCSMASVLNHIAWNNWYSLYAIINKKKILLIKRKEAFWMKSQVKSGETWLVIANLIAKFELTIMSQMICALLLMSIMKFIKDRARLHTGFTFLEVHLNNRTKLDYHIFNFVLTYVSSE